MVSRDDNDMDYTKKIFSLFLGLLLFVLLVLHCLTNCLGHANNKTFNIQKNIFGKIFTFNYHSKVEKQNIPQTFENEYF